MSEPSEKPLSNAGGSFLWLVIPVVVGGVFSKSIWLGKTVFCFFNAEPECWTGFPAAEAGMLTLAGGFVIVTFVSALAAYRRGSGAEGVVTSVVGAVIGGAIAVAQETSVDDVVTTAALEPLFFVFVAGLIFILPIAVMPHGKNRFAEAAVFLFRLALAALIGGFLTALVQAFPIFVVDELFTAGGAYVPPSDIDFPLVRPVATGLLISPWILITFDPRLRPWAWAGRSRAECLAWIWGFLIMAIALVAIYVLTAYVPDHSDWLEQRSISVPETTFIFCALLLSPLFAAGVAVFLEKAGPSGRRMKFGPILLIAVSGAIFGAVMLAAKMEMPRSHALFFASLHAAASLLALTAAWLVDRLANAPATEAA